MPDTVPPIDHELAERITAAKLADLISPAVLAQVDPDDIPDYYAYLAQVLCGNAAFWPAEAQAPFAVVEA
jgi:hypothetical protein